MGMNQKVLMKFLWGEYYWSQSKKKIFNKPPTSESKPMFVQFVMDPLVKEYQKLFSSDMTKNSQEYRDARTKIKALFSKWMPVEKGILSMVILQLPSPVVAQKNRIGIICPGFKSTKLEKEEEFKLLKEGVEHCRQQNSYPVVVSITKMQPFNARLYDIVTRAEEKSVQSQRFVAFSRVFSGTLKVG